MARRYRNKIVNLIIHNQFFYYIVFPGLIFSSLVGVILSWIDRKITARIQWRKGPPWYQPIVDILKLFGKEIIIPEHGNEILFLLAPFFALSATIFAGVLILLPNLVSPNIINSDLILIIYLLMIPGFSAIIGGSVSSNPLASLGLSRDMKIIISYELPLILALFTPLIKNGGLANFGSMLAYQSQNGMMLRNPSCIIAFIVAILCINAKLGGVPFDFPEAETEIMSGTYIEYSGLPLALFKLTKMILTFILPVFLITIFMNGFQFTGIKILTSILKFLMIFVIIILIKVTNPRLRVDQAFKFFWFYLTGFALLGIILAYLGV